jgi:hypothetical protein
MLHVGQARQLSILLRPPDAQLPVHTYIANAKPNHAVRRYQRRSAVIASADGKR